MTADDLLHDLRSNPESFRKSGRSYDLLECFFRGHTLLDLSGLLADPNEIVKQTGAWIASELGRNARPIIRDVAVLLTYPERRVRYYALEVLAVCAVGSDVEWYGAVLEAIRDVDAVIRDNVARMIVGAHTDQVEGGLNAAGGRWPSLLAFRSPPNEQLIQSCLASVDESEQRVGVIATCRAHGATSAPFSALGKSPHTEVRRLAARLAEV
jgi:hypothetical protein